MAPKRPTKSPGSPVTLHEVARRAGVHISTASRALSSKPSGVSAATVERVRRIAQEVGYIANPAAASLRTNRSRTIGVLVPRLTDIVLARIYEGIAAKALEAGYTTFVSTSNDDMGLRPELLESFLRRRVDGMVICDSRLDGDSVLQRLAPMGIPYVLANRAIPGHPSVTTDDVLGGELAARHLLEMGHDKVGVAAGLDYANTCVRRTHGFVRTYLTQGRSVAPELVVHSQVDDEGGYNSAKKILQADDSITAIFAINDFAAVGAMSAAIEIGRQPGKDFAVVGFNDIPLAQRLPVPLSSVRSDMFDAGWGAAEMLLDAIGGEPGSEKLLTPTLEVRASSRLRQEPS